MLLLPFIKINCFKITQKNKNSFILYLGGKSAQYQRLLDRIIVKKKNQNQCFQSKNKVFLINVKFISFSFIMYFLIISITSFRNAI